MKVINYWSVFTDYNLPLGQRVVGGALLPIMGPITLFGSGCSDEDSLRANNLPAPIPRTDGSVYESKDAALGGFKLDAGQSDLGPVQCIPETCDGFVDLSRSRGTALCISFKQQQNQRGLVSSGNNSGVSLFDFDRDGAMDILLFKGDDPNQFFRSSNGYFENISQASGMAALVGAQTTQDAAWNDFDGDGDFDLFLAGTSGSHLFENQNGHFYALPDDLGIHDPQPAHAVVWFGANLLLATENGTRFYRKRPDGSYEEAAHSVGLDDPGDGRRFAVADYDGDGFEDIYLANSTGRNRLFRNRGNGIYESVEFSTNTSSTGDANSLDAHWVKINGERLPSLNVLNFGAGNQLYINKQDGSFEERAAALGIRASGQTSVAAWGDFLNEGRPASFLGRWEQSNLLYLPVLSGTEKKVVGYQEISHPLGMDDTGQTIATRWLDFNGDENLDLLVVMAGGGLRLFENKTHPVRVCP